MNKIKGLIEDSIVDIVLYSCAMYGLSSYVYIYMVFYLLSSLALHEVSIGEVEGLGQFMKMMHVVYLGDFKWEYIGVYILTCVVIWFSTLSLGGIALMFQYKLVNLDMLCFVTCNSVFMLFQREVLLSLHVLRNCLLMTVFFLVLFLVCGLTYSVLTKR